MSNDSKSSTNTRRDFIKKSTILVAGSTVAGNLQIARAAHAYGDEVIKIGLVGCGGRGTGAAVQAMNTNGDVHLVAMADVFEDRLEESTHQLRALRLHERSRFFRPSGTARSARRGACTSTSRCARCRDEDGDD